MAATTLETATMIRLFGGTAAGADCPPRRHAAVAGRAVHAGAFLLFPRVERPALGTAAGCPQQPFRAPRHHHPRIHIGPRAERQHRLPRPFRRRSPPNASLYWRGPVMDDFDSRAWRRSRLANPSPPGRVRSPRRLRNHPRSPPATLAACTRRPVALPDGALLTARLQAFAREPVRQRAASASVPPRFPLRPR